jgi:hypothetical protein
MSFRKGNQKERRDRNRAIIAQRGVPPLPKSNSFYSSHCISRPGRHDCSIHCKSSPPVLESTTSGLYVCNRFGLPVELWEKTVTRKNFHTEFKLIWRQPDYRPIAQFVDEQNCNTYPCPPINGFISEEPFSPVY